MMHHSVNCRLWRYAILGAAVATFLYTFCVLTDPEYSIRSREPPLIDRLGFIEFMKRYTEEAEARGSVREEAYEVPAKFGIGTKSNFTSSLFPTRVIGQSFNSISLPNHLILTETGDASSMDGETFNPAILKMPRGMKEGWEYIVVARGPRIQRTDLWVSVSNRYAEEHGLVEYVSLSSLSIRKTDLGVYRFPATLSPSGEFLPTPFVAPRFLPMSTYMNNTSCGYWTFPFGPQDPRLYFTDEGRPAMSFSMNASGDRCRSVGWVGDLRSVWEELRDAMKGVDSSFAVPWREGEDGKHSVQELLYDGLANM